MTEEELVIFDILTRPAPELSTEKRAEAKKVACDLLKRLKQLLVLNWRQKAAARAQLKLVGFGGLRQPRHESGLVVIELKKAGVPARAAFDERGGPL